MGNVSRLNLDIIGKRFGRLVVESFSYSIKRKIPKNNGKFRYINKNYFKCKCDCGNYKDIVKYSITKGNTLSCGCIQKESIIKVLRRDLSGKRFGKLLVKDLAPKINNKLRWNCICDCGNKCIIGSNNLSCGKTQSCGCMIKEILIKRNKSKKQRLAVSKSRKLDKISTDDRDNVEYREWRRNIIKAYNYMCIICNSNKDLNVHHLESYWSNKSLRLHPNNGVLLCKVCHKKFHKIFGIKNNSRGQFSNFFEYIELTDEDKMNYKPVVVLDFFGVVYKIPENEGDLYNLSSENIVKGSIDYLKNLIKKDIEAVVWVDRDAFVKDKVSFIKNWMDENGFPKEVKVTTILPRYNRYISANVFRFRGNFDEVMAFMSDEKNLVPWNRE